MKTVLALLVASLSACMAQEKNTSALRSGEIPSLEVVTTRQFAGKALYGYIDGGADLYHECGFDRLIVQEVRFRDEPYLVEVFRMTDPLAALGIFTVSRGNGARVDSLGPFSCASSHAIQWARSKYFVRIANSSGSSAAQAGGRHLADLLASRIQGDSIKIPSVLSAVGESERSLLFVRGILGMQNGFDDWSALVDGLEGFEAYIVMCGDSAGQAVAGDFRFKEEANLRRFLSAFTGRGKLTHFQEKGDRRVIVLESDIPADSLWGKLVKLP